MTNSDIRQTIERVLKELDKVKVDGYTFREPSTTRTTIRHIEETNDNSFCVELYTDELKFGGIDDNDDNDGIMESDLMDAISKIVKKSYKEITIDNTDGSCKGYWSITVSKTTTKKEKSNFSKKEKLKNELVKYRNELTEFQQGVKNRILNQKSKKKTCNHCGSNVNTQYFKSHKCPVCHTEMYTDTDKKRVNTLNERISTREKSYNKLI